MRLLAQLMVSCCWSVSSVASPPSADARAARGKTAERANVAAAVRQSPPRSLGDGCSLKSWTPSLQGRVPCGAAYRQLSDSKYRKVPQKYQD